MADPRQTLPRQIPSLGRHPPYHIPVYTISPLYTTHSPANRMTDRSKSITFSHLCLQAVITQYKNLQNNQAMKTSLHEDMWGEVKHHKELYSIHMTRAVIDWRVKCDRFKGWLPKNQTLTRNPRTSAHSRKRRRRRTDGLIHQFTSLHGFNIKFWFLVLSGEILTSLDCHSVDLQCFKCQLIVY